MSFSDPDQEEGRIFNFWKNDLDEGGILKFQGPFHYEMLRAPIPLPRYVHKLVDQIFSS
jgi:hypothetical protein